MQSFDINISDKAQNDLISITEYLNKFSIEIGAKYFELIMNKILRLNTLPLAFPLVRDPVLRKKGIRWIYARNYTIYFVANEDSSQVIIERILYSRRAYDAIL
jgi:plasmid stabilization system protein ParE